MGPVPIMNKDTMSSKATLALTSMAAKVEKKAGNTPSQDAVAALDDLLSITKGVEFFGATTKTYRNNKDELSGSYCTIPVKYQFKDRDTRFRAEAILRSRCNVQCTTPYPTILRHCIKTTVDQVKADFPDNFVRVNVDVKNLALKLARRPKLESTKGKSEWVYYSRPVKLPREVLNIQARTVPENLVYEGLPPSSPNLRDPLQGYQDSSQTILGLRLIAPGLSQEGMENA